MLPPTGDLRTNGPRLRAVLFDVGGPIDREEIYERLIDGQIREALAANGVRVTDEEYAEANRRAIASFAPNAYRAIIWHLAGHDVAVCARVYEEVARREGERHAARGGIELREGIAGVIEGLRARGLRLALAANQSASVIERLAACGLAGCFDYQGVAGTHGLRKPDPRLFLHACEALGVTPGECVMVGDRIDNDIVPARLLGMRAVRFRTGRHIAQLPRSWDERPDAEASSTGELEEALAGLIGT